MTQTQRSGFTFVELLVTLVIMGTLLAVSVFILGKSRSQGRDAQRVSDVQVIRAALEHHWLQKASYPVRSAFTNIGTATFAVLSSNGLEAAPGTGNVYLSPIPTGPFPNEYYQYISIAGTPGYSIRFTTETPTAYGPAGTYYAHSSGVDTDVTQK